MRILLILLLSWAVSALAWTVQPQDLVSQPARTRESQLREFHEAFKPEYDSYLGFDWMLLPKPDESRLQSPYGIHNGFAFRQRFAIFLQNPIDSSVYRMGFAWWVERQGWQNEDFLFIPPTSEMGVVRDIHTLALTASNAKKSWAAVAGLQWQNPEQVGSLYPAEGDSLWWFSEADWKSLGVQAVFHREAWTQVRATVELEARALRGGDSTGWKTYLPDLEALVTRDSADPLRLGYRQNIWRQRLYLDGSYWVMQGEHANGSLLMYTDASHLVGLELGARRRDNGKLSWGVGIEAPFARVSFNLPREYDQLFHSHGSTILVELHMSLGAISKESLFRRNAPRSAPMETDKIKKVFPKDGENESTLGKNTSIGGLP